MDGSGFFSSHSNLSLTDKVPESSDHIHSPTLLVRSGCFADQVVDFQLRRAIRDRYFIDPAAAAAALSQIINSLAR